MPGLFEVEWPRLVVREFSLGLSIKENCIRDYGVT